MANSQTKFRIDVSADENRQAVTDTWPEMEFAPVIGMRVSAEPIAILAEFHDESQMEIRLKLDQERSALRAAADRACEAVEAYVPDIADDKSRRAAIQIKRDLFNLRIPSEQKLTSSDLPAALQQQVDKVITQIADFIKFCCCQKRLSIHHVFFIYLSSFLVRVIIN